MDYKAGMKEVYWKGAWEARGNSATGQASAPIPSGTV